MTRTYIKDIRHRFSYELRPDPTLDRSIRVIAAELERDGLLESGASVEPRFQPHLTICRAATLVEDAVRAAAAALAECGPFLELSDTVCFGDGRIICLVPRDRAPLDRVRARTLAHIQDVDLDPAVRERDWTPHITVAYAVPEAARERALAFVRSAMPIGGTWRCAQAWDLDVRPTRCAATFDVRADPA